ncbi:hypothetical protein F2Q70_00017827 [Brassica cretica]|uniref:Uncharacterized protein n=1 Tax=Brassica cretica TaxID=69181 RepID=A0A8S9HR23_BRACR|nr:hypothetical protein F2Q68_00020662 [Brassica cretica]KAF2561531.1 hypothetical protein F2Q70_00017827 [Brassica cretica]
MMDISELVGVYCELSSFAFQPAFLVRSNRVFPPLPSLVNRTESFPEQIGFWSFLDVYRRLPWNRWRRRRDPSRRARLQYPLNPSRDVEDSQVPNIFLNSLKAAALAGALATDTSATRVWRSVPLPPLRGVYTLSISLVDMSG